MRSLTLSVLALIGPLMTSCAMADDALASYVSAVTSRLDARMQSAIARIEGVDRRLLAIRSYVRVRPPIEQRWSWTTEQIEAFYRSPEYRNVLRELDKIKAEFAARNPGYQLHVNTDVRSLEVQIERWNENPTVARAAREIERAAKNELNNRSYESSPTEESTTRFVQFLRSWYPGSPPSLAAPGLSRHGQARAFDFHVQRGDTLVASTEMSAVRSVWDKQGWTAKVQQAVHAASDHFRGPLQTPREPWHYEYEPLD